MIQDILQTIPDHVTLVAATKGRSAEEIMGLIDAGISHIGENYVQQAKEKHAQLKGRAMFHCIGHLQSNKIKQAVEIFDMIQTLDSEKTLAEIEKRCAAINKVMPVCIEVNIAKEPQKHGCMPKDIIRLAKAVVDAQHCELRGIMTMGPVDKDLRPHFQEARKIFRMLQELFPKQHIDTLSMGMSDSYQAAIEEGATMVRIGSGLFEDI